MTLKYRGFTFALAKSHGYSSKMAEQLEDFSKIKFVLFAHLTLLSHFYGTARTDDKNRTKRLKPLSLTDVSTLLKSYCYGPF